MIEKRLNELYERAYEKYYNTFSDFLNLDEQNALEKLYLPCVKFGGYNMAERIVAGFGENIEEKDFPISVLEIAPVNQKFADKLTHRDFLGGVMNLGIKRELIGDIIVNNNVGYLFCLTRIKSYILENLSRLKHTSVTVREIEHISEDIIIQPETTEIITASLRLDAVISSAFKLSRSEAVKLFRQDKVFVNSRQIDNTSYQMKENDVVSVRGFGRIQYQELLRTTKKDRLVIRIKIYK
ncbi:MAG: YlmH/Sll1252 family protein [Clostridium sp.]|nr:YlmH/Sll1252 family protein [Clostridium sp.]